MSQMTTGFLESSPSQPEHSNASKTTAISLPIDSFSKEEQNQLLNFISKYDLSLSQNPMDLDTLTATIRITDISKASGNPTSRESHALKGTIEPNEPNQIPEEHSDGPLFTISESEVRLGTNYDEEFRMETNHDEDFNSMDQIIKSPFENPFEHQGYPESNKSIKLPGFVQRTSDSGDLLFEQTQLIRPKKLGKKNLKRFPKIKNEILSSLKSGDTKSTLPNEKKEKGLGFLENSKEENEENKRKREVLWTEIRYQKMKEYYWQRELQGSRRYYTKGISQGKKASKEHKTTENGEKQRNAQNESVNGEGSSTSKHVSWNDQCLSEKEKRARNIEEFLALRENQRRSQMEKKEEDLDNRIRQKGNSVLEKMKERQKSQQASPKREPLEPLKRGDESSVRKSTSPGRVQEKSNEKNQKRIQMKQKENSEKASNKKGNKPVGLNGYFSERNAVRKERLERHSRVMLDHSNSKSPGNRARTPSSNQKSVERKQTERKSAKNETGKFPNQIKKKQGSGSLGKNEKKMVNKREVREFQSNGHEAGLNPQKKQKGLFGERKTKSVEGGKPLKEHEVKSGKKGFAKSATSIRGKAKVVGSSEVLSSSSKKTSKSLGIVPKEMGNKKDQVSQPVSQSASRPASQPPSRSISVEIKSNREEGKKEKELVSEEKKSRKSNEGGKKSNEGSKKSNEGGKKSNEGGKKSNEGGKKSNEGSRKSKGEMENEQRSLKKKKEPSEERSKKEKEGKGEKKKRDVEGKEAAPKVKKLKRKTQESEKKSNGEIKSKEPKSKSKEPKKKSKSKDGGTNNEASKSKETKTESKKAGTKTKKLKSKSKEPITERDDSEKRIKEPKPKSEKDTGTKRKSRSEREDEEKKQPATPSQNAKMEKESQKIVKSSKTPEKSEKNKKKSKEKPLEKSSKSKEKPLEKSSKSKETQKKDSRSQTPKKASSNNHQEVSPGKDIKNEKFKKKKPKGPKDETKTAEKKETKQTQSPSPTKKASSESKDKESKISNKKPKVKAAILETTESPSKDKSKKVQKKTKINK